MCSLCITSFFVWTVCSHFISLALCVLGGGGYQHSRNLTDHRWHHLCHWPRLLQTEELQCSHRHGVTHCHALLTGNSVEMTLNLLKSVVNRFFQNAKVRSFSWRGLVVKLYKYSFYWSFVIIKLYILIKLFCFTFRLQPTSERAVQAEWLLGNVSGFTQPGLLNMRWRKQLCLRFRGPTWEM